MRLLILVLLSGWVACESNCGALRHGIADAGNDDGNQSDGVSDDEDPGSDQPPVQVQATIQDGYDWWLPNWVIPTANSGFVAETVDATNQIHVRVFDLTWEQINPEQGVFDKTRSGQTSEISAAPYEEQFADPDPFWLRIWTTGVDWVPGWVQELCSVVPIGQDHAGFAHLPIWNACLWQQLLILYRTILVDWDLRSDPRLRFVQIPGGFSWCVFNFDVVSQAVAQHGLTHQAFDSWFHQAMADLAALMNGENQEPTDDYAYKLVYTGQDYPDGPWGELDDHYAASASAQGMGSFLELTEISNYHANHAPAFGCQIEENGHMQVSEDWSGGPPQKRILLTEHTCFDDCGNRTIDTEYAVRMANLKALQLRANWIVVDPSLSYLQEFQPHWEYVRLSLGKQVGTSADAWVVLREAEDTYFRDKDDSFTWDVHPWVRNYERWIIQRDLAPDGVSKPGTQRHEHEVSSLNGVAWEGRQTDWSNGSIYLYFDLDEGFATGHGGPIEIKVTYLDRQDCEWWLEYADQIGNQRSLSLVNQATQGIKTATFLLESVRLDNVFEGLADFRLAIAGPVDLEVTMFRMVKLDQP